MRQTKSVLKVELGSTYPGVSQVRAQLEAVFARGEAVRRGQVVADENERARLINDITRLIREPQMPEGTRAAGLTLIGWLARRMPGEQAHALGVDEARESERRLKAARKAVR
jgi:hypothetical protein